ncbi:hypothetical protein [Peptoniphilus duerdenii]|uniref:hypothetical protein n=1 Tax=Peptoniphilus duerdenii TaxID=507750 RepID=UPI00288A8828|nr:hypothetical protein [Peptoniphilus duerdenii]
MKDGKEIFKLYELYKNDNNIFNKAVTYMESFDFNDVFDIIFVNEISLNLLGFEINIFKELHEVLESSIQIDEQDVEKHNLDRDIFESFFKELRIFTQKINTIPEVSQFPLIYLSKQLRAYSNINMFSDNNDPDICIIRLINSNQDKIFLNFTKEQLIAFRKFIDGAINSFKD